MKIKSRNIKEFLSEAKWIYSYAKGYRAAILFYVVSGLVSVGLGLAATVISKYLIDAVTGHKADVIAYIAAAYVGMGLARVLTNAVISRISAKIEIKIQNEITADVFDKVLEADWENITAYHSGDLLNRLNSDVSAVSSAVIGFVPSFITRGIQFVLTLGVIAYYDKIMALIVLVGMPLSVFASRYVMRKLREYSRERRRAQSDLNAFNEEALYNLTPIKAFSLTEHFSNKLRDVQNAYKLITLRQNKFSVVTTMLYSVLGLLISYACYAWGVYRLWTDPAFTFGTMTMFLQLAASFSSSLSSLVSLVPGAVSATTAAGRLMEIVTIEREGEALTLQDKRRIAEFGSDGVSIELKNISFTYLDGSSVYTDASLRAESGEVVALVGPSGQGKTTMLRVLLGLIKTGGSALVTSRATGETLDISPMTRRLFAYVSQDNTLFSGTVRDNLALVSPGAEDERLIAALEDACAWDFLRDRKDGLDTLLGEKGEGLSEGQRQRITIARALLTDSPVILMDEATSALDMETEERLIKNILRRKHGRTIILATHRPSILSACDRVYTVKGGRVQEG